MSCGHSIPPGYRFCSVCGVASGGRVCACGFVAQPSESFCGQCGGNLFDDARVENGASLQDLRYDLNAMIGSINFGAADISSSNVHATQDEIEQLFKSRDQDKSS